MPVIGVNLFQLTFVTPTNQNKKNTNHPKNPMNGPKAFRKPYKAAHSSHFRVKSPMKWILFCIAKC